MSKFESFIKSVVVTAEYILLNGLAGGYEFNRLTSIEFILYTISSLIVSVYVYNKSHDWNNSILNRLKQKYGEEVGNLTESNSNTV